MSQFNKPVDDILGGLSIAAKLFVALVLLVIGLLGIIILLAT